MNNYTTMVELFWDKLFSSLRTKFWLLNEHHVESSPNSSSNPRLEKVKNRDFAIVIWTVVMWFLMDGVTSPGKFLGFLERKFQSLKVEKNFGMSLEILCLFQSPTPRSRPTWWSLDWRVSRAPALLVASYWAFCWSRRGFYRRSGLMLYHSRSRSLKI